MKGSCALTRMRWLALAIAALAMPAAAIETVLLRPVAAAVSTEVPRIGLNLGGSTTWGADQLMANVLKNPGFEATTDRTLIVVKSVAGNVVTDDTSWLGRVDGFWNGARFEVRTGPAAGRTGRVADSRRAGSEGPGRFALEPYPSGLRASDALVVTTTTAAAEVPLWWVGAGHVRTTTADARPGSPGKQSVRLLATPGTRSQLNHHLDAIGDRAGKLLPLSGTWLLAFWARGGGGREPLNVKLARQGSPAFLEQSIATGRDWKRYEYRFSPADNGPPGTLTLSFDIANGEVLLDDVSLGEAQAGPGGFRASVAALLGELKPGYLRDWQGQLGDPLENRLASPFARHPVRYRPGDAEQRYLYSLPEFLELCAAVGAQPWVVAPSLLGDAEWQALGTFLAQAAAQHHFREILLEFGNENWNELFRPGGFPGETAQAEAADRAFRLVKAGAGSFKGIVPLVNAQYVNPASWGLLAGLSREAARVAVAPYFLHSLGKVSPDAAAAAAFAEGDEALRSGIAQSAAHGKGVSVYEVNFHTTSGDAGESLRNLAVTGAHSGAALARRLLQATLAGVREQAVYSLAGFDSHADDRKLVRLWGVARDLAPGQLRPTGLALEMLNSAFGGSAHASECAGAADACRSVTAVWFREGAATRLALVSAAAAPLLIRTNLPCTRRFSLQILDGSNASVNNETAGVAAVGIAPGSATCRAAWEFELPARSLAVLRETAPRLAVPARSP